MIKYKDEAAILKDYKDELLSSFLYVFNDSLLSDNFKIQEEVNLKKKTKNKSIKVFLIFFITGSIISLNSCSNSRG